MDHRNRFTPTTVATALDVSPGELVDLEGNACLSTGYPHPALVTSTSTCSDSAVEVELRLEERTPDGRRVRRVRLPAEHAVQLVENADPRFRRQGLPT